MSAWPGLAILLRRQLDAHKVVCDRVLSLVSMAGICYTILALPANVFSIWMNFSGSVIANRWSRRPPSTGD